MTAPAVGAQPGARRRYALFFRECLLAARPASRNVPARWRPL